MAVSTKTRSLSKSSSVLSAAVGSCGSDEQTAAHPFIVEEGKSITFYYFYCIPSGPSQIKVDQFFLENSGPIEIHNNTCAGAVFEGGQCCYADLVVKGTAPGSYMQTLTMQSTTVDTTNGEILILKVLRKVFQLRTIRRTLTRILGLQMAMDQFRLEHSL